MKKKIAALLLTMFAAVSVAVGCGNGGADTEKETKAATEAQTEQVEKQSDTEEAEKTAGGTERESEKESGKETTAQTETEQFREFSMYALDDVYVREAMDADAKVVTVAERGSEVRVTAEEGDWYKVSLDGKEGYMMKKFLTESKEEAEGAVKAEEAAQEAARREAEAQQQQSDGGGRYEVSRQKFDDCDGSGHGYAIVTYSDGSTETVEY